MILSTMRVPVRPVFWSCDGQVYDVPSQRLLFKPSEGQPRMFRKVIRLLAGAIICRSVILLFYSTELHEFVQGNTHIGHNHEACCCLDSKPTPNAGVRNSTTNPYDYYSSRHQAAGFANSAIDCNAVFVNVGRNVVLVAKKFIPKRMHLSDLTQH